MVWVVPLSQQVYSVALALECLINLSNNNSHSKGCLDKAKMLLHMVEALHNLWINNLWDKIQAFLVVGLNKLNNMV